MAERFNPLFVGVWLLNRLFEIVPDPFPLRFNPLFVGVWLLNCCTTYVAWMCWIARFNPLFVGVWLLNWTSLIYAPCKLCFNPLFVGVWLLNRNFRWSRHTITKFQPFICWSVAFEFWAKAGEILSQHSFNPLFVGVWLLNTVIVMVLLFFSTSFNPLFVGVWLLNENTTMIWIVGISVSTLYLLECGFWI